MKNKTVLITGGAKGLGKELSLLLIEKGYPVIIVDKVNPEDLPPDFRSKLLDYFRLDLADTKAVIEFIRQHLSKNELAIDILVINAFPRVFKAFKDFKDQEIINFVNVALLSQLLIANVVAKRMIENDFGRIISINSKSHAYGYSSGSLYCSLKSAWMTFHESLSKELLQSNKNVSMTTICPDSFADTAGNKSRHYDFIIKAIKKRLLSALSRKKSSIYYAVTFKTRIIMTYQLFKKIVSIR